MEETIQPAWLAMTTARLERHLKEHKYPVPLMHDILQSVRLIKARQRKAKIKATVSHQLWDDILKSARLELGGVRTMKAQTKRQMEAEFGHAGTTAKFKALCAYEDVLTELIAKLVKVQKAGEFAPGQFVAYIKEKTGRVIPNNGEHWSDYVSAKQKRHVRDLFEAAPNPARGKRKDPFERRISPDEHVIKRSFLVGQMNKAKEELDRNRGFAKNPELIAELDALEMDLQRAYLTMDRLRPTTPLPARWQGLLNM